MSLSGFVTLATIITPIIYPIIAAIITVFFTEYIRRRISSTRSQKIFLFALKDYDKEEFLNDYNIVKHRINISLIGQSICEIIFVVLFTIIYGYALISLFWYKYLVGFFIVGPRAVASLKLLKKSKLLEKSRQDCIDDAAGWGIMNNPTASLIVSITAFFIILLTLQLRHANFIQNNLEISFMCLVLWLIFAYIPTAVVWLMSRDIRSNITTSWEFRLINLLISDLNTIYELKVKLNYGHEVKGNLLQANNFGIILEDVSKEASGGNPVKIYVPWQEVVSIEIEKTKI